MRIGGKVECPECGHANGLDDYICGLCGEVLQRVDAAHEPRRVRTPVPQFERDPVIHTSPPVYAEPASLTLKYLALGALLAPLFTFTPLLQYMGWFLGALVHEMGHCAMAWLAGCPAYPAISLAGHAMARHADQVLFLSLVVWFVLGWLTWQSRENRAHLWLCGTAAALYPLFAFTGVRDFVFLLSGHAGELTFAAVFFWRGLVGGFSESRAERVAYTTVACYLVGHNVWLAGGLLFDAGVRAWYSASGSFGLTNDYIRAGRMLGVDLGLIAFFMLLASLTVLPLVWFASRARSESV